MLACGLFFFFSYFWLSLLSLPGFLFSAAIPREAFVSTAGGHRPSVNSPVLVLVGVRMILVVDTHVLRQIPWCDSFYTEREINSRFTLTEKGSQFAL